MSEHIENATTDFDFHAFQRQIIAEFRNNEGRVGGMFEGATLVLLTTIGARTGRQHTCPLAYLEVDEQAIVVASANGAPTHPAWYHNIRANPMVTVELGAETFPAIAAIAPTPERDRLFERIVDMEPGFGDYQAETTRVIPVVTLHRVNPAEGAAGIRGLGDFLVESHDWLRGELAELQQQVAELVTADAHEPAALPPCPSLTHGIRAHCSEFCSALWHHHTGETTGAFPLLAERFPGLDRVLRQLADEHRIVARIQGDIAQLVENYRPGTGDPATLAAHLHSLAQELENHFAYEEQSIVAALNALGPAPTDIP